MTQGGAPDSSCWPGPPPALGKQRYLGIDFSGAAAPWRAGCRRPTVWIAAIEGPATPRLLALCPVQALPGDGAPFDRLVDLLRAGNFAAAGIDAPFALPAEHMPEGGYEALLGKIRNEKAAADRPFPSGAAILALASKSLKSPHGEKIFRETEQCWRKENVVTRSTLWNGPRGGAAFTAACLTLLARAGRPVWPWNTGAGMLVEAFPAAQLAAWDLQRPGYGKPERADLRLEILTPLASRIAYDAAQAELIRDYPDALDAVLAAFAGIAAERIGAMAAPPIDGQIAVLDADTMKRPA